MPGRRGRFSLPPVFPALVAALALLPAPAGVAGLPPAITAEGGKLLEWLYAGGYRSWPAQPRLHPSAGPHFGNVRVFANPSMVDSLRAGDREHPPGAVAVKELFGPGQTLRGWAVIRKHRTGNSGATRWRWFEYYDGEVITDAWEAPLCQACHQRGHDMVLTMWPQS